LQLIVWEQRHSCLRQICDERAERVQVEPLWHVRQELRHHIEADPVHLMMPVVGFLHVASANPFAHLVAGFRQGLEETGYIEGRNVAIVFRWAEGQSDRLPALAAELVGRQMAVIVAGGVAAAFAAKAATTNEALCDRAIVRFTCGQQDGDKAPFNICECVNLRVAPSTRAANSLLLLPPFHPPPSGALSRAWSRCFALWNAVLSAQAQGTCR
jgi:hypothetical protein